MGIFYNLPLTNMTDLFVMEPVRSCVDKDIIIFGPDGLCISVDYDDVDHPSVEHGVTKMLAILNREWDK